MFQVSLTFSSQVILEGQSQKLSPMSTSRNEHRKAALACGYIHQGDTHFSSESRGQQCIFILALQVYNLFMANRVAIAREVFIGPTNYLAASLA